MIALRTLIFSIFVPGMVAIVLPCLYVQTNHQLEFPNSLSIPALAGVLVFGLGVLLYFWCASEFTFRGKGTPAPLDPPKLLVSKGPYRWTRNPMYVAVLTAILGEALFFHTVTLAAYALALFGVFHLFITTYEEPTLQQMFGAAYSAYRRSAPRWLRLWPKTKV